MPETISCPSCRRQLVLPDEVLGRQVRCPACLSTFRAEASPPLALPVDNIPVAEEVHAPAERAPDRPAAGRLPWDELEPQGHARPKRRKSSAGWWVVGGLVAVLALIVTGLSVVGFLWYSSNRRPRVVVQETPEQRRQVLKTAFSRPVPLTKPDPALEALFTDLGDALQKKDQARVQRLFDAERMFDEVVAQGMTAPQGRRSQQAFAQGLAQGLSRSIFDLAWSSFEIRNIAWSGDKEAAVIIRHRQADGDQMKLRWFLTRESGSWKVYDFEDLRAGLRTSTLAALTVKEGLPNAQAVSRACNNIRDAGQAIQQRNLDHAETLLRQAQQVQLPRPMLGLIFALQAEVHLLRSQPQEALDCLQRAATAHPDMPVLNLSRGAAYNQQGKWDEALEHLQAYQELLGDEEPLCLQLGEALRGKERFAEAATAYRKALDFNPKNIDAFLGLLYSLAPTDRRDDVPERFARLDDREESFRTCVEALRQAGCQHAIDQLAEAMHKLQPGYTPAIYPLCLARIRAGQWQQGVQLFRDSLARQKDPVLRREHLAGFLQAMVQANRSLDAYAAAPEPRQAFALLVAEMKKTYRARDLGPLVERHAKKVPDDPLLPLCRAEILVQEERYAEAERTFAAAMTRRPDRATCDLFRASRVLARYHSDSPLSAYHDIGPRQETFEQLAELLLDDGKQDLLETLLSVHGRTHPTDQHVHRFRMRARIRQDKVDEGIALFKSELARPLDKEQRDSLVAVFLDEMLASGRPLEAYRAAPDPVHAFQVLAANLTDDYYDMEALEKLVAAHRRRSLDPKAAASLALYEAEVLLDKKQWDQAVRVCAAAWERAPEDSRGSLRHRYAYALYKAGRVRQAYDTVPPRKETFGQLANLLTQDRKGKELEELIAAHRPHAGAEPDLDYFAARARVFLGRYAEGQKLLEQACKKQPVESQRRWYVNQFCQDMNAAGKPLDAYRSTPDRQTAFAVIARELAQAKKPAELQALLDEHGKRGTKDPDYLRYRGELALLRGEPAQAEPFFAEALALAPTHEQWWSRSGLSRARIRAKKAVAVYEQSGSKEEVFEELARMCLQEKDDKQLEALVAAHRKAHAQSPTLPAWDLDVKWLRGDYEGVCKLVAEHRKDLFARPAYRWKADDYLVRSLVKLGRGAEAVREVEALARQGRRYPMLALLAHAAHGGAAAALAVMQGPSRDRPNVEACYHDPDLGPLLRSEAFASFRKKLPPLAKEP